MSSSFFSIAAQTFMQCTERRVAPVVATGPMTFRPLISRYGVDSVADRGLLCGESRSHAHAIGYGDDFGIGAGSRVMWRWHAFFFPAARLTTLQWRLHSETLTA